MEPWIFDMAKTLVYEVTQQMSGICLEDAEVFTPEEIPGEQAILYGLIRGDYELHVQLLAERRFLYRLAYYMMDQEPSEEDVKDYALEYFNTVCGRFISEIINQTHISVKLFPVRYEMTAKNPVFRPDGQVSNVYFVSDQQEQMIFSWTSMPIKNMTRSGKNE